MPVPIGSGCWRRSASSRVRPFTPDAHAREILDRAAKTAYKTSRVIGFEEVVGGRSYQVYPDRHWAQSLRRRNAVESVGPIEPGLDKYRWRLSGIDARINFFTNYYSISPGMVSKTPGKGAKYMIAFTDSEGTPLSGGNNYRLKLPPNIPAANFWSVTLYEAENSSGLANGQPFPSLGLARQASAERRRQHGHLPRPQSARGQSRQLARDCAGQGVFRHPQALRPDRSRHRQELEARRHREGEIGARPTDRGGPPGST